jgi:dTDP-4-dehydrorhamnose 3,5-epimerase
MIEGVRLTALEVNPDNRGSFSEIFSKDWDTGIVPAQWSVVRSHAGVLRGMHLHRRHDEYFLVVEGRASVGLRDLRPGSETEGVYSLFELTAEPLTFLAFPPGILHGWYFHEESIHIQSVSETYESYRDDDNLGCHWSDPELEIPWPATPTLVAERAAAFPSLRVLLEQTAHMSSKSEVWGVVERNRGSS